MSLHHVLHDRQAKSGAAGFPRAAAIHPVEPLGQTGNVFGRDTWPRIAHRELEAAVSQGEGLNVDRAS